eukprot:8808459-Karenia_brevis.AAC.1
MRRMIQRRRLRETRGEFMVRAKRVRRIESSREIYLERRVPILEVPVPAVQVAREWVCQAVKNHRNQQRSWSHC